MTNKFSRLGGMGAHIIIILAVGALCYSNTLKAPFQWDDIDLVEDYPIVRDLSYFSEPSKAGHLDSFSVLKNRYVGYLTFALNYKLHGVDVTGYHIVNISVHLINSVLVYLFVLFTFKTPFLAGSPLRARSKLIALFSALLFVSHPVQTEAVTYIFQRLASLMTTFYLLSMVCYIKYGLRQSAFGSQSPSGGKVDVPSAFYYSAALISCILAMKTKENAFTLPIMIAMYEFFFFEGRAKKRALRLIPILLTLLVIPLTMIGIDRPPADIIAAMADASRGEGRLSRLDYMFTQFRVIITYIRLLLLPVNQTIDYDYPLFHSFFDPQVVLSFLALLSILCLAVYLFLRSRVTHQALRVTAFGIFWFFIALSVESSIIPIPMLINEYRVYLPSVGIFSGTTAAAFLLMDRPGGGKAGTFVLSSFIVITLVFSYASYSRNAVWESQKSLWEDVVKKSPKRARAYYNLGCMYLNNGFMQKAAENFETALKLRPDFADAHTNLGIAYRAKGMTDKAIEHYRAALELKPGDPDIYANLGNAYRSQGMTDKAIEYYSTALRLDPDDADTHRNLGDALRVKGLQDKAEEHYLIAGRLRLALSR